MSLSGSHISPGGRAAPVVPFGATIWQAGVASASTFAWLFAGGAAWTSTDNSSAAGHTSPMGPFLSQTTSAVAGNVAFNRPSTKATPKAPTVGAAWVMTWAPQSAAAAYRMLCCGSWKIGTKGGVVPQAGEVGVYTKAAGGSFWMYACDDAGTLTELDTGEIPDTEQCYQLSIVRTSAGFSAQWRRLGEPSGLSGLAGLVGELVYPDPDLAAPRIGSGLFGGETYTSIYSEAGAAVTYRAGPVTIYNGIAQ